jgi:hypothetical protein
MSDTLSKLFQGQPIPPQPTGSDVSSAQPLWLQQYVYNLANAATNLSGQPYSQFPGQTIAQPSAQTLRARQLATDLTGDYQPFLNTSSQMIQSGSTPISATDIQNYQNPATGGFLNNLQADNARIAAGSTPLTADNIQTYLNPYTSNVVGALQTAANKNLFENQLPQIQDRFVTAGQSRSPQEMQATNNALYQSNQALDSATANALQAGYGQALQTAAGQQQVQMAGGTQMGAIDQAAARQSSADYTAALSAASGQKQLQQTGGAQMGALGSLTQQLGGYDVGQLAAAGQSTDVTNQSNINSALNQFYAQQQWPYQNLAFASNIIRGQPVSSNTQTVGLAPATQSSYTASPLTSFIGTTLGGNSLLNGNTRAATPTAPTPTPTPDPNANTVTNNGQGAHGGRVVSISRGRQASPMGALISHRRAA